MMLSDGDMNQYDRIKQGSIGDYLIKLNNYVDGIERQITTHKQQSTHAKRK